MATTNNFFDSINEIKPPKKKKLLSCHNGELRISEDKILSFRYEKKENQELINKLNEEIEGLEKLLEKADLYEKVLINSNITKLERKIQKESQGGLKNGDKICKLSNRSQLEEIKNLILKADTNNIWSVLYWIGYKFAQEFGFNNLSLNVTDQQLDTMTPTEATSYTHSEQLPRSRE